MASGAGLVAWSTLSYHLAGGTSRAWAVGPLLAAAAYMGGRWLGARWPAVPPVLLLVGTAVLLAAPRWVGAMFGAPPSGRPMAPLGYANASAALFVVAAAAFLLLRAAHDVRAVRALSLLGAAGAGALVVASRSRAGVAVLVVIALGAVVRRPRAVHGVRWGMAAVLVAAVALTWTLALVGGDGVRGDDPPVVDRVLSTTRLELWEDAAALAVAEPLTGVGPGNFEDRSPTARADRDLFAAHSTWLLVAAELGWPGLALFLGIVVGLLGTLLRAPAVGPAALGTAVLVAVATHAAVDYVLWAPGVVGGTMLLVGSAVSAASGSGKPRLIPSAPVMP